MKNKYLKIFILLILGLIIIYKYIDWQIGQPFILGGSSGIVADEAYKLINTTATYTLNLENISKFPLKITYMEFTGHSGISIDNLATENGEMINNHEELYVPSHRKYIEDGWGTNQSLNLKYQVKFLKPKVTNPKQAIITYKIFGLKQKQTIELLDW